MIPILTSAAMRAADARGVQRFGQETLVRRAGTAVAREARTLLRSCYGARVAVICGPGLNGADGRVAGAWLRARGARVEVIDVRHQPSELCGYELVIDAAFGLGCSRPYVAPRVREGTPVVAVDLPSGVDADSGALLGAPMKATLSVALGALKFAHVRGPSTSYVGELRYASLDIVDSFVDGLIEDDDLTSFIRIREDDHKWRHAVHVFAGSPTMPGAAHLALHGALVGGASMVHWSSIDEQATAPCTLPEVVLSPSGTVDARTRSVVAGPGLGPSAPQWLARHLTGVDVAVVLDASGLDRGLLDTVARHQPWILTPHDGEFERLSGASPNIDRLEALRALARATDCVVLLKGPTTLIADPSGVIRVVNSGTSRLASAGSGDVLSGLIGASIARGHDALNAAALSAHLHGRAGARLSAYASASRLPRAISAVIGDIDAASYH